MSFIVMLIAHVTVAFWACPFLQVYVCENLHWGKFAFEMMLDDNQLSKVPENM